MTEALKAALDGWFGGVTFWLVLVWVASLWLVPRSCEEPCVTCPWDRDGEKRRRYWTWRVWRAHLEVVIDAMYVVLCAGRVVCDLVLGEATWTLPLFGTFGVLCLKWYLGDLHELDRVRAKRAELSS